METMLLDTSSPFRIAWHLFAEVLDCHPKVPLHSTLRTSIRLLWSLSWLLRRTKGEKILTNVIRQKTYINYFIVHTTHETHLLRHLQQCQH